MSCYPRPLVALVLLPSLAGACKKADDAGASSVEQAARVEKVCEGMNDLSLAYVAGVMEIEVDELDSPTRTKIRAACKTLPFDVAQCADRLALDDASCDKALEAYMGMTDSSPQGEGPEPSWALTIPFEVYDLAVGPDGAIAIAGAEAVAVVEDGALRWSKELPDASSRVAWAEGQVITGRAGTVQAFDASGEEAWSKDLGEGVQWLSAIAAGPDGVLTVVANDGQIIRMDAGACSADAAAEGCASVVGTVEAVGGKIAERLDGGALLASGDNSVVLVSAAGELLAQRAVDYDAGSPRGGIVVAGNEVLAADPSCEAGAESCFEVLATAKDLELVAPLRRDSSLVYADSYGVIASTGAHEWKVDGGNDSDLLGDGTSIYSVGHQLGLDTMSAPPQVRAIDPKTGKTQWITKLGTERASLLSGPLVELHDGVLVVSTKTQLFAVPVGAAR